MKELSPIVHLLDGNLMIVLLSHLSFCMRSLARLRVIGEARVCYFKACSCLITVSMSSQSLLVPCNTYICSAWSAICKLC